MVSESFPSSALQRQARSRADAALSRPTRSGVAAHDPGRDQSAPVDADARPGAAGRSAVLEGSLRFGYGINEPIASQIPVDRSNLRSPDRLRTDAMVRSDRLAPRGGDRIARRKAVGGARRST